jgi:predicted Zn-dependent protease
MRRLPLLPFLPLFPLLLLPTPPAYSQPRSPIPLLAQTQLTPQQEQQLAELYKQFSEKYQQGKYDEALSLAQKLVPFIRGKLGSNSSEFAYFLTVLGIISVGRNSPAEAESFFKEALVINVSAFGDKHPNTAMVLEHLSRLYSNHIRVVKLMVDKMQESGETYSGLA